MITPINDITRHFERLGLRLKIKAAPLTGLPQRAIIEVVPGGTITAARASGLIGCYFEAVNTVGIDRFSVLLSDFKPDGYGHAGICKVCGCSENDACINEAGNCWWVMDDLCSACATDEDEAKITTLEDDDTEEGILVNIIYDCDWCDMSEESINKTVAYLKENYIITRRAKA